MNVAQVITFLLLCGLTGAGFGLSLGYFIIVRWYR